MVSLSYYGFAFFICILLGLLMILYNYLFSDIKRQKKLLDEKENKLLRLYQSVEDALDDFNDAVERSHSDIEVKLKDLGNLYAEVERGTRGLAGNIPSATRFDRAPAAPPQPSPRMAPPQAQPPVQQPAPAAAQPVAQAPVRQPAPQAESIADSIGQAAASIRATAPGPAPAAPQGRPEEQAGPAQQTMAPPPAFRRVMEVAEQMPPSPAPAPVGRNELIISMASEGRTRSQIAKELGITLSEVDLVIGMNK